MNRTRNWRERRGKQNKTRMQNARLEKRIIIKAGKIPFHREYEFVSPLFRSMDLESSKWVKAFPGNVKQHGK